MEEAFLTKFAEILDIESSDITMDVPLDSVSDWDSMAVVSFIALADSEYHKSLSGDDINAAETVRDLFKLVV